MDATKRKRALPLATEGPDRRPAGKPAPRPARDVVRKRRFELKFSQVAKGMPLLLVAITGPNGGCYISHERAPMTDAAVRDATRDRIVVDTARPDILREQCFGAVELSSPWTFPNRGFRPTRR